MSAWPSQAQDGPQPTMSLDAIVNASQTPTASLHPDDAITVDGRSVIGSITSERRRPRKLDIRHPTPEVSSPLNPERKDKVEGIGETMQAPSQEAAIRRKPRKLNRDSIEPLVAREESQGGVALNQSTSHAIKDDAAITKPDVSRVEDTSRIVELPVDDQGAQTPVRRRPRKLNRNRSSNATLGPQPTAHTPTPVTSQVPIKSEIDALKERVHDLESQVRELYERPQVVTARSPRRRGKGRKASADGMMTPNEELSQLQAELVSAQNDLAALKIQERAGSTGSNRLDPPGGHDSAKTPRPSQQTRAKIHTGCQPVEEDEEIEDIPRTADPSIETGPSGSQKAVTLSGSYKIRLPNNLDIKDVKALQDGVTSATNIAKRLAATRSANSRSPEAASEGKSWGEWFGSYSQSIARIMHNVETEAALASTPTAPQRVSSTSSTVRRTPHRPRTVVAHSSLVAKRSPVPERGRSAQMAPQMTDALLK